MCVILDNLPQVCCVLNIGLMVPCALRKESLKWLFCVSVAQSCPTLRDPMDGSSVALDNFLLCLTVEGPKTETLAVSSFPKVHDFCNPSPLRNGTLFKAGI